MDIISLGAGVQSTTMLLMTAHGEITPKPKYAIFADTKWEPKAVYEHLNWLKNEVAKYGIEVIITSKNEQGLKGAVYDYINGSSKFVAIPFYTINENGKKSMGRRQCTNEYKIKPVKKAIRTLLGYKPRQHMKHNVTLWMGISTDEITRAKPNRDKWITNRFPLLEKNMSRNDCLDWLNKKGYPRPPKSSCIGCPFHDNALWLNIKNNDIEAWQEAVSVDNAIRNLSKVGTKQYLHYSCTPLLEIEFQKINENIDNLTNECTGMCGL